MRVVLLCGILLTVGCVQPTPAPAPALAVTKVDAPFGKTWNAVVDILAERNIPVKTLDRASGFVAAELTGVAPGEISSLATGCGGFWDSMANGGDAPAGVARYNILVRGDSTSSTVKVTARFTELIKGTTKECATRGTFETPFQNDVKSRAESK